MLQSVSVEGFKSFKNYAEVDLKKTQYQSLEKTNVKDGILKGCMFVGGNASGKTNFIEALLFLLRILFSKREVNWDKYLCMFSESDKFENIYQFLSVISAWNSCRDFTGSLPSRFAERMPSTVAFAAAIVVI